MKDWRNREVEKICKKCGSTFIGKYNSSSCHDCKKETKERIRKSFKESNPNYWNEWSKGPSGKRSRRKYITSTYNITVDDYYSMLSKQGGCCAVCGKSGGWVANGGELVIDHCHSSGIVRGLLCPSCNRGLGQFFDNPEYLRNAARYVEKAESGRESNK